MVSEEIKDRNKKKKKRRQTDYRMQKQGCHQGKGNKSVPKKAAEL